MKSDSDMGLSAEVPNLTCRIEFTHSQILELLSDDEFKESFRGKSKRGMNVAEVAFRVGYESLTQFTREYSRVFGFPPRKDMKRLKGYDEQQVDAKECNW